MFDALGIVPIASYSVDDSVVNDSLTDTAFVDKAGKVCPQWYKKGLAVISENHLEGLHSNERITSATVNGYIKEFTRHLHATDEFDFF
jgi:hypothetical protein